MPFFLLRANMRKPENLNALDHARFFCVSAPVEFAVSTRRARRRPAGLGTTHVYLVDVKKDQRAPRAWTTTRGSAKTVHRLEQHQAENQRAAPFAPAPRDGLRRRGDDAQVVGKDFTEFFRVTRLVLDRGSREVRTHMPVVSPDGVVGAVLHASQADSVDVQLAVDAAFGIDVEDDRTPRARLQSAAPAIPRATTCKVEMVDSRDEVEIGDLVGTSGKGRWFPRGLPVARVAKVVRREETRPRSRSRRRADGRLLAPRRGARLGRASRPNEAQSSAADSTGYRKAPRAGDAR